MTVGPVNNPGADKRTVVYGEKISPREVDEVLMGALCERAR